MDSLDLLNGLFTVLLYAGAHFGVAFFLVRWGRKHFGAKGK